MEEKNKQFTVSFQGKKNKTNIKKIDYISLQKKDPFKTKPCKKGKCYFIRKDK